MIFYYNALDFIIDLIIIQRKPSKNTLLKLKSKESFTFIMDVPVFYNLFIFSVI